MRDARAEAFERLGGAYEVRVLEPSPPAVVEPPWYADDPVARGHVPPGRPLVLPLAGGDLTWDQLAGRDEELATWCADRWLGAWRRLQPPPALLDTTREALHTLAEHVLSAARHAANGKIGLRWTLGGFGTPFFKREGRDWQVRVDGADLVVADGDHERRRPITTAVAAAAHVGIGLGAPSDVYAPTTVVEPQGRLSVHRPAAAFLGDWFGFAASVLEEVRADAAPEDAASRVQLWPEHFDMAVDLGDADGGRRANYGASPGDEHHPEPYLYVGPWHPVRPGDPGYWNASFGASLPYAVLLAADDQRAAALAFLRRVKALLDGRDPSGEQIRGRLRSV